MKRKYPFVKQKDEKDCGVACLSMILQYYDGNMPYDMLYDKLDCNHLGTSAYKLVTVARELGFSAVGLSCKVEDILDSQLPCIAHVLLDNKYYHYMVIYEINHKKNKIIVADPSSCIKTFSLNEFISIFNQVIIELFPMKKLPVYQIEQTPLKYIVNIIKNHKKDFKSLIIISILSMIFYMLASLSTFLLLNQKNIHIEKIFVVSIIILYLLKNVISCIQNYKLCSIEANIREEIKLDTFQNIIFLPYKIYCNRTTGEIVSRMVDANNIGGFISSYIMCFSIDSLNVLCSIILLWIINVKLTIMILMCCIIYYVFCCFFDRKEQTYQETLKRKNGEIHHQLIEYIEGFETIKGLNKEETIVRNFKENYHNYEQYVKKISIRKVKRDTLCVVLEDTIYVSIGLLGIYMIQKNRFSLSTFILFYNILNCMFPSLKNFVHLHHQTYELKEIVARMLDFNVYKKIEEKKKCEKIKRITMKQVSYERANFKTPLFNFDIKLEDKIFVYGQSGGGKSTLLKLLKGYYQDYEGRMYINKNDRSDYDKNFIKNRIVYISQQETLFTDTVYNNICMGHTVDMEMLEHVLKITRVDEILKDRNIGLKTLIEENGSNFSGGERQRIILARALLEDADVFLFDESFSEMDSNMERIILKNIIKIWSDKLIIVVSHRFDNQDLFNAYIHMDKMASYHQYQKERSLVCLDG